MKEGDEVWQIKPEKVRFCLRELVAKGDIPENLAKSSQFRHPLKLRLFEVFPFPKQYRPRFRGLGCHLLNKILEVN